LENLACGQPWFLLEQLAQQSFAALRAMIPADAKLSLTVTKLKPMVLPLLRGGASIQLADA
jgi:dihydroneopterin aldolase